MGEAQDDARLMAAALALSRRGLGLAAPNPSVGALIVKDGVTVGAGVTGQGGRPHGEVLALEQSGALAKGATLYVTLEPCSHHGKTPPCADAVIAAGVMRVVSAMEDPNPKVAGEGHRRLRAAGIDVLVGVHEAEARRLHLGHILLVTEGRPMVTLKLAETADGFAAGMADEPRLMITGAPANGFVQMMRAMHDAILIGGGTALADDPLLTVRLPGMEARKPLRVVLDSKAGLALESKLVATAAEFPTLVIAGEGAPRARIAALEAKHVEVGLVAFADGARLDLRAALSLLAARGITRILSEGGPRLANALIAARLADEVVLLKSPTALGHAGLTALAPEARMILADESFYRAAEARALGADQLTRYERKL